MKIRTKRGCALFMALAICLLSLLLMLSAAAKAFAETVAKKMNVLFILADDLGWTDLSCYGSTYHRTPNIDRLAQEGMKFQNAYAAAPYCVPSRAALMTGQFPARCFWGGQNGASNAVWSKSIPGKPANSPETTLSKDTYNIAELLGDNGYATGHFGKWHLGGGDYTPEHQGFDVNYAGGHWGNPGSYIYPFNGPEVDDAEEGDYLADKITDNAVDFISNAVDSGENFFTQVWFYSPHLPFTPLQEDIDKYRNAEPSAQHKNPAYAAMIDRMDQNVGRLVQVLKDKGVYDDTLLVFMSDNGGFADEREPVTSNYPLRGGKGTLYEGGMRVPLIVKWKGVAEPGSVNAQNVDGVDLYPTFAEAAGAPLKEDYVIDGQSLVPYFKDKDYAPERDLMFYDPLLRTDQRSAGQPGSVLLSGEYKLLVDYNRGVQLYNVREDVSEKVNLAAKCPEKVAEMYGALERMMEGMGTYIPVANPDFDADAFHQGLLEYYEEDSLRELKRWDSDAELRAFTPLQDAELSVENGVLTVREADKSINATFPAVQATAVGSAGYKVMKMRYRSFQPGQYTVRLGTTADPDYIFPIVRNGEWNELSVLFYTKFNGPKLILSLGANKDYWGFNVNKYGFALDEFDRGYLEIDSIVLYDVPDLAEFSADAIRKIVD